MGLTKVFTRHLNAYIYNKLIWTNASNLLWIQSIGFIDTTS